MEFLSASFGKEGADELNTPRRHNRMRRDTCRCHA